MGLKIILAGTLIAFGMSFSACAEKPAKQDRQENQAAGTAQVKPDGMGMINHEGMMGKMDMDKMHAMMGECMKMHKDGKMCDSQMMEQCQKNMEKGECSMMMKKAKSKTTK